MFCSLYIMDRKTFFLFNLPMIKQWPFFGWSTIYKNLLIQFCDWKLLWTLRNLLIWSGSLFWWCKSKTESYGHKPPAMKKVVLYFLLFFQGFGDSTTFIPVIWMHTVMIRICPTNLEIRRRKPCGKIINSRLEIE